MRTLLKYIGLTTMALAICPSSSTHSQQPASPNPNTSEGRNRATGQGAASFSPTASQTAWSPAQSPGVANPFGESYSDAAFGTQPARLREPLETAQPEQTAEFQKAIGQLRTAKTDEAKTEARGNLNKLVGEQLDRDLEYREKTLTEIENRVKEMRAQLDERRKSKAEIQKMIMLMIEQPQVGLGLPRAWMNAIQPAPTYYAPTSMLPAGATIYSSFPYATNNGAVDTQPVDNTSAIDSVAPASSASGQRP